MPNKRRVLILLVLASVVALAASFQFYRLDQQFDADRVADDTIVQQLAAADMALGDVRLAQAAYVSAGQDATAWTARFDDGLARLEGMLRERQQTTTSTGALTHYDAAIELLANLKTSDRRARNYVNNEQFIAASDVIFVQSYEVVNSIAANIAAARDSEAFAADQSMAATVRNRQLVAAGGLTLVLLVGIVAYRNIPAFLVEETSTSLNVTATADTSTDEDAQTPAAPKSTSTAPATTELTEAADICVDLARLLDGRDLPALLGRAAQAIGAKGLVLWISDESGQVLRPSLAHGYSARTLAKLGELKIDADNVTSLACRTLRPQSVPAATADGSGALAVPLIGTAGCVGVLSAEVTGTCSGHEIPMARVIAAQLSAVIVPGASAAPKSGASTTPAADAAAQN